MRKVLVQLDYYLGGQFAGLTSGLARGAFAARGLDVRVAPPCAPGGEGDAVLARQRADPSSVVVGVCEQNSLAAAAPVKAFGAMFDRSPLAVVAKRGAALRKVAVHADSAELVAEALGVDVVVVERADEAHRAALLAGGAVDGVQCYHTTEPLAFFAPGGGLDAREHEVKSICATAPGSLGALDLGYSQALFADADAPQATLDAFLAALMEGWAIAAEDPILAGEVLAAHEAADDAALFGGAGRDALFHGAVAARCAPAALRMAAAGGRVDGNRWRRVDDALAAAIGKAPVATGGAPLPAVAAPALGHVVARGARADARLRARGVLEATGRKPKVALVRAGDPEGAQGGAGRAAAIATNAATGAVESWFDKTRLLEADGVDVAVAALPAGATAAAVAAAARAADADPDVDAVLVERPLRETVAFDLAKDVDANDDPVMVEAILRTLGVAEAVRTTSRADAAYLDRGGADLAFDFGGAAAVVLGRSPHLGAPLAKALAGRDATVTLCHAATPDGVREKALEEADFVFAAAGRPGLVGAGDVKRGAAVVNVGTTYDESAKTLAPDVDDAVADDAAYVLTTNAHGCGPACVATLVRRVVERAEDRALAAGEAPATWRRAGDALRRDVVVRDFAAASALVEKIAATCDALDHHPTVAINGARVCHDVAGCGVAVEFTTFAAGGTLTVKDSEAARAVEPLLAAAE